MSAAPAVSFDDIIKADRQKKKNEALAESIFGKGRRASAPGATFGVRKAPVNSLASRVGVTKPSVRSSSAAPKLKPNVNDSWVHDLHNAVGPALSSNSRLPARTRPSQRSNAPSAFLRPDKKLNVASAQVSSGLKDVGVELRIRGVAAPAGPIKLIGENFARKTSAEDIEKVMGTYCQNKIEVTSMSENLDGVTAEILVEDQRGATRVIEAFNNIIADGRKLRMYIAKPGSKPATTKSIPSGPRNSGRDRNDGSSKQITNFSKEARRQDDDRMDYQDGSYGFGDDRPDAVREDGSRRLYSDELMRGRRGYSR